jgi:iron(III) transport system permease protein
VFVTSAGLFDVPLALASPVGIRTVPTEIYGLVQYPSDLGRASSLGVLILLVTVALTLLQRRYLARRRYDVVSGKGYRPRLIELRGGRRVAAYVIEGLYIGCGVVLPVIALVLVSLSSLWTGRFRPKAATIDNYDFVLFGYELTRQAIINSLVLALAAASITVVLAVLQSYYLHRSRSGRRTLADILVSLPLGIPGIILALGFLLLAIRTPLYSTLWIILIAYVARFFPFGTRTVSALMLAINPELEHSARASGATWLQTVWFVLLPLLRPALIAAWLMMFVICIRELGATILLYAQGTETISVALVILNDRSAVYVAALAVIQLVLLLIAFSLFKVTRISVQT